MLTESLKIPPEFPVVDEGEPLMINNDGEIESSDILFTLMDMLD